MKTEPPSSSSRQLEFTPEFKRNLRHLARKYRRIKNDIQPLVEQLLAGENPGNQIPSTGYTVFKVRIRNSDQNKGKRSGYRVIYYLATARLVILITIYSKTEQGDIPIHHLRRLLATASSS